MLNYQRVIAASPEAAFCCLDPLLGRFGFFKVLFQDTFSIATPQILKAFIQLDDVRMVLTDILEAY